MGAVRAKRVTRLRGPKNLDGRYSSIAARTRKIHCTTDSLVTWLVNPFGLVSILLGQLTHYLADA